MRLRDAARYLSISPHVLRRLIQQGEISFFRVGEHAPWLLDTRELDQFIERTKIRL